MIHALTGLVSRAALFALLLSGHLTAADFDSIDDTKGCQEYMAAFPENTPVWIARPLNEAWTKFEIAPLPADESRPLLALLKKGSYGPLFGDHGLFRRTLADQRAMGVGFIILKHPTAGHLALRKRTGMNRQDALGLFEVTAFDPETRHLRWNREPKNLWGAVAISLEVSKLFKDPERRKALIPGAPPTPQPR